MEQVVNQQGPPPVENNVQRSLAYLYRIEERLILLPLFFYEHQHDDVRALVKKVSNSALLSGFYVQITAGNDFALPRPVRLILMNGVVVGTDRSGAGFSVAHTNFAVLVIREYLLCNATDFDVRHHRPIHRGIGPTDNYGENYRGLRLN